MTDHPSSTGGGTRPGRFGSYGGRFVPEALVAAQAEVGRLRSQVAELSAQHDAAVGQHQAQVAEAAAHHAHLKTSLEAVQSALAEKERGLSSLRDTSGASAVQAAELENQVRDLQGQLARANEESSHRAAAGEAYEAQLTLHQVGLRLGDGVAGLGGDHRLAVGGQPREPRLAGAPAHLHPGLRPHEGPAVGDHRKGSVAEASSDRTSEPEA